MNKKEYMWLEKTYEAEVNAALNKNIPHLMQTKSKYAKQLAEDGFIALKEIVFNGVTIKGYELTNLGRLWYCSHARM